ncbi:DNA-binding FadR family transcriptional regulator [Thermocatellispora tengchongensis]|uniref:DNA-binding FadR family transcriptional regulator n=1 Tax=Thermocatellispora tengchongensis TaxID=1073253 RepID=A0A840PRY7_9ACTN|nr:FCD domain-containing protein [Thermocatellispora tengchongensis]MBB5140550.1 DNA-binding FadR family transcriptional regulator [Thermocatellispora tengchongensis]
MAEIGRAGAHDRVVLSIGTAIVSGEIAPDEDLDVVELQERFGVSRTAVREALRVLTAKGLVGARPRRGTFVAPREQWAMLDADVLRWRFADRVDERFLDELGEVRLTVEPAVARMAALRRTDRDLAALEDALAAMREATGKETAEHVEADLAFHHAMLRAAHNELMAQMAMVIEVGLRLRDQFVHATLTSESADKHAEVLLAVRRQRPRAAEAAMRALIERSIEDVDIAKKLHAGGAQDAAG